MNTPQAPERAEIEALLPWHAAGTLSRRDAQRVEAALAQDAELARRYALVREELAETIHLNETLGAPSARAMEKLFAKIDAEAPRPHRASLNIGAWLADLIAGFSPRTLAWSASAAALLILLQAALIAGVTIKQRPGAGYQTASAPAATAAEGAYALVRFAPQASADDITRFLQANKLTVVGGPAPDTGMFKLRVAVTGLPKEELARIVKRLQQDQVVGIIATVE